MEAGVWRDHGDGEGNFLSELIINFDCRLNFELVADMEVSTWTLDLM